MQRRMVAVGVIFIVFQGVSLAARPHYPANPEPLMPEAYVPLPLGAVVPQGWLRNQLETQANGLTGHLDEFWPIVSESVWKGMSGDAWERAPYYLDGLVPLAYQLNDERLKAKVQPFVEWILDSGQEDGWFGPPQNKDRWPLAVALKVLAQYYEATHDERVITLMKNYCGYLNAHPPDWPDSEWRGVRAMENVVSILWLFRRTKDLELLDAAKSIYEHSFDWTGYFLNFPYTDEVMAQGIQYGHPSHVVNIAMALKYPALWYQVAGKDRLRDAVYQGITSLYRYHGQAAGRFAGDEHLSGRHPSQGTELCGVVEEMFSLEQLVSIFGDPGFTDMLEKLAYNANPGACTPDYWAHQYDQQSNQVLCSVAKRQWSTNSDTSNLYGLEPNYGCCTANMHQGWPKLVSHLWMATRDGGLAAVAYGPSEVTATVADGVTVSIREVTDYPFDGTIELILSLPRSAVFPLQLRIPAWAEGATVKVNGEPREVKPSSFAVLDREWKNGDKVLIDFPMPIRIENRYNNSIAIVRGPVYYSLKIGERFQELKRYHDTLPVVDWEVHPTSPWNYGLIVNRDAPQESFTVERHPIDTLPFSNDKPPVEIQAKGRIVKEWGMAQNSAAAPPPSPVTSDEPETSIVLIPYGCTRLRITEFPTINPKGSN